ncbi:LOW QUALITY PROTEIN: myc box-dependent-interacting protein 1-like [Haliotis rubra]|uniref:LOW QUALITY PROTEIN: myc box-dependent-interacting protein 1-like n=1 Tax=Haliotis rubra TaxID=36100 RepID=UPI001EE62CB1|nr:LOW QUALITY PROTEIN: myc box-dependent-interacting protein 1-like [Haliotis rubra]
MAENSKGGILAKAQKRLTRTKTKVLQNLGRAERTHDETFDEYVTKVERQQDVAHRIQKELKNYLHCVRALSLASRSFYASVSESYEPGWTRESEFKEKVQSLDLLWTDYLQKLHERSLEPMNTYLLSFPTLKARVSKRGRKQVDYDNARHNLEVLQNAKKRDDGKILKAQEELNEAKKIYEDLNNDLHSELPDFYNSRVTFYGDMYQNLFGAENIFHHEIARVSEDANDINTQLSKDFAQFVYKPKRPLSKSLSDGFDEAPVENGQHHPDEVTGMNLSQGFPSERHQHTCQQNGDHVEDDDGSTQDNIYSNQDVIEQLKEEKQQEEEKQEEKKQEEKKEEEKKEEEKKEVETETSQAEAEVKVSDEVTVNGEVKVNGDIQSEQSDEDRHGEPKPVDVPDYGPPQPPPEGAAKEDKEEEVKKDTVDSSEVKEVTEDSVYDEPKPVKEKEEEKKAAVYQVPPSNKPLKEPPPDVLYVVQSTHPYQSEDQDELSFESGEMIYVIKFENPDEQVNISLKELQPFTNEFVVQ